MNTIRIAVAVLAVVFGSASCVIRENNRVRVETQEEADPRVTAPPAATTVGVPAPAPIRGETVIRDETAEVQQSKDDAVVDMIGNPISPMGSMADPVDSDDPVMRTIPEPRVEFGADSVTVEVEN